MYSELVIARELATISYIWQRLKCKHGGRKALQ